MPWLASRGPFEGRKPDIREFLGGNEEYINYSEFTIFHVVLITYTIRRLRSNCQILFISPGHLSSPQTDLEESELTRCLHQHLKGLSAVGVLEEEAGLILSARSPL